MTPAKALDNLASGYWSKVDDIAAAARAKYVIPFCDRKGWKFTAGMGFRNTEGVYIGWAVVLPARLYTALTAEVLSGQELGSLMADYTPTSYKPAK